MEASSNKERTEGGTSSESESGWEGIPALEIAMKRSLKITTYQELHSFIVELVILLEEVYEMGIL